MSFANLTNWFTVLFSTDIFSLARYAGYKLQFLFLGIAKIANNFLHKIIVVQKNCLLPSKSSYFQQAFQLLFQ